MIARRGPRRADYARCQRRGRACDWKPRYPVNREYNGGAGGTAAAAGAAGEEDGRVFSVLRRPIAARGPPREAYRWG